MSKLWQHAPLYTHIREHVRVQCACGRQSKRFDSWGAALHWYAEHSGLRERRH